MDACPCYLVDLTARRPVTAEVTATSEVKTSRRLRQQYPLKDPRSVIDSRLGERPDDTEADVVAANRGGDAEAVG